MYDVEFFVITFAYDLKRIDMKFTKEEAGKELAAKLSKSVENIDAWDRTIRENVETLWGILGEENEIELNDFVSKSLPLFNTTAGFMRKTNADLAKSYEEKIEQLKKNQPIPPTPPTPDPNKELIERLAALEKANEEQKTKLAIETKRKELTDKLKDKGVKDAKWINDLFSLVSVQADTDVDAEVDKYVNLYNSSRSRYNSNVTPSVSQNNPDDYVNNTIKAAAAMRKSGVGV